MFQWFMVSVGFFLLNVHMRFLPSKCLCGYGSFETVISNDERNFLRDADSIYDLLHVHVLNVAII